MNRFIIILHGISGFSIQDKQEDKQMVSAHDVTEDSLARLLCEPHFFEHFSEKDISFFCLKALFEHLRGIFMEKINLF